MRSTGEVIGLDMDLGMAYLKSQLAAGNKVPFGGNVFLSVAGPEKNALVPVAKDLVEMGYGIYATRGTATVLRNAGIKAQAMFRIFDGRPNVLDLVAEKNVSWIVNIPSGAKPQQDEVKMRAEAARRGVPITTTMRGLQVAVQGIKAMNRLKCFEVCSLQEAHRDVKLSAKRAAKKKKS
jgi:carbamoyl-phosphate synthase large subunit